MTEVPHTARCPQCHRAVLAGHLIGLPTLYDPQHLSPKGEGEAIIRRLKTYLVTPRHLSERTLSTIKRDPNPVCGFVVREHRCTAPDPDPRGIKPKVRQSYSGDEPPDF